MNEEPEDLSKISTDDMFERWLERGFDDPGELERFYRWFYTMPDGILRTPEETP